MLQAVVINTAVRAGVGIGIIFDRIRITRGTYLTEGGIINAIGAALYAKVIAVLLAGRAPFQQVAAAAALAVQVTGREAADTLTEVVAEAVAPSTSVTVTLKLYAPSARLLTTGVAVPLAMMALVGPAVCVQV